MSGLFTESRRALSNRRILVDPPEKSAWSINDILTMRWTPTGLAGLLLQCDPGNHLAAHPRVRSMDMSISDQIRKALFMSGLLSIALSVILDAHFATDAVVAVPGPGALALLAVGGVSMIAVALTRRRKK